MPNMVLELYNLTLLLFVLTTSSLVIRKRKKKRSNVFIDILKKKTVCEYDQEIPQSQTADKCMASRGRATVRRQTKQSNQLSLPHQGDCKNRK